MSRFVQDGNYSSINERRKTSRSRLYWMAFLAVVVFWALLKPQSVAARPRAAWMTSYIILNPTDGLTICLGQQKSVSAKILVETSNLWNFLTGQSSYNYPPSQQILAKSSNSNVAAISPAVNRTMMSGKSWFIWEAVFQISAKKVGTSTITFSDDGYGNGVTQSNRPIAVSETLTVTVKECGFRIIYFNLWPLPDGFTNPRMTSSFDLVVFPDDTGKFGPVDGEMENWLEATSQPGGGLCSYKAEGYKSKVTASGNIDWKANKWNLSLVFAPVKGKYDWTCPTPFRPIKVQKELEDGQVDQLDWIFTQIAEAPVAWPFYQSLTTHQKYTGHGVVLIIPESK